MKLTEFLILINEFLIIFSKNIFINKNFVNLRKLDEKETSLMDSFSQNLDLESNLISHLNGSISDYSFSDILTESSYSEIYNNSTDVFLSSIHDAILLGFDQYEYSKNLITFFMYLTFGDNKIDLNNVTFKVSITYNRSLRILEEEANIYCNHYNKNNVINDIYIMNCTGNAIDTPSKVKYISGNIIINGKKPLNFEETSLGRLLGDNIQNQRGLNNNLKNKLCYLINSNIINEKKNISVEGETLCENELISNNSNLIVKDIFNKSNNISCKVEKGNIKYKLVCNPKTSVKADLNQTLCILNEKEINLYLRFKDGEKSSINYIIEPVKIYNQKKISRRLSDSIILVIIIAIAVVLAIICSVIFLFRFKTKVPLDIEQKIYNSNTGISGTNSTTNISNK